MQQHHDGVLIDNSASSDLREGASHYDYKDDGEGQATTTTTTTDGSRQKR